MPDGSSPGASPRVSVLLPVHDAEPWLEECLDSLAAQSFEELEVVAVDDGSRDGSGRILEARARRDPRFRVLRRRHAGLVAALDAGLAACRGELVARMDADDVAHPRRLELQVAAFDREPRPDVVSCRVRHFPEAEVGEGFRRYEEWLNGLVEHEEILRERFIESPIPHPSAVVRRAVLEAAGGYRDRGWPEDYDLWLRLAAAGRRFAKVPEPLYRWRHHEGRLTRTDGRYALERFLECKAHHLARGPLAGHPTVVWGAGQTGRRLSKHLLREGVELTAFVDIDPRKIGRTLRRRPIHAVEELPELLDAPERPLVLTAVSSRGARRLIRERLDGLGLTETRDYWCAA